MLPLALKKKLNIVLFLTLMLFKVSAATVHFHDCEDEEPTEECQICEDALHHQKAEFSAPSKLQNIEIRVDYFLFEPKVRFQQIFYNAHRNGLYFGRPPPFFL